MVHQGQPHLVGRPVSKAVEGQDAGAGGGDAGGNDQREILVESGRVGARVGDHIAGADANDIFAGQGRPQVHGLDVVPVVGGDRIGNGLAIREAVAAIDGSVGANNLEVEVIDQGGDGPGESGCVCINQSDFERLILGIHQNPLLVLLARCQRNRLVEILVGASRVQQFDQVNPAPAFVIVRHRAGAELVVTIHRRVNQGRFDQGRGGTLPAALPLFDVPHGLVKILNRDLRLAGIPKHDERGRTVDVHALRCTFGTLLSKHGVAPRTAQAAMRHSKIDPRSTLP